MIEPSPSHPRLWWLCSLLLATSTTLALDLSPAEQRGKVIYLTGKSPGGGEIVAVLGEGGAEVPGSLMPCANCHGADGRGRPEGGVVPSDVTWPSLTKPYEVTRPSGRKHPAYDEAKLVRAVALGLDPAGNALAAVMPRYRLSQQDAADLVAYLKRLAEDRDPGIAEDRLTVGLVLPEDEAHAAAVRKLVAAAFAEINDGGGIFARRLELVAVAPKGSAAERAAELARFLDTSRPFAVVGAFLSGAERELAAAFQAASVPAVGAMAIEPAVATPLNRYVFYLYAGLSDMARALAAEAADRAPGKPVAVVAPASGVEAEAAAAAARELEARGVPAVRRAAAGSPEALALAQESGAVVFLGGGEEARALLTGLARAGFEGAVLAPGPALAGDLLGGGITWRGRLVLAFPTIPADISEGGAKELEQLLARAGLASGQRAALAGTFASLRLLADALRALGKDLSREALITHLEGLYARPTGLTPPLTFGPNRRVGAGGVYLLEVDAAAGRVTAGSWRDVP